MKAGKIKPDCVFPTLLPIQYWFCLHQEAKLLQNSQTPQLKQSWWLLLTGKLHAYIVTQNYILAVQW